MAQISNEEWKRKYLDEKKLEFEHGCEQTGDMDACFSLGEWHQLFGDNLAKGALFGKGHELTRWPATELYALACSKKHANSCFNLGMIKSREAGASAAQQQIAARSLFDQACGLGHVQACLAYSTMCMAGRGGAKDCPAAMRVLVPQCEAMNDARACVRVGAELLKPDGCLGPQRNPAEARRILARACDELGHPNACQMMAVMYKKGDGVDVDAERSEAYRKKTIELLQTTGEAMGTVKMNAPSSSSL